jgi:hypothetical protein
MHRNLKRSIWAFGSFSILALPTLAEAQTINRYLPAVQYTDVPTHYYPVSPTYNPPAPSSPYGATIPQPFAPQQIVPQYYSQPTLNPYPTQSPPTYTQPTLQHYQPRELLPQAVPYPPYSRIPQQPLTLPATPRASFPNEGIAQPLPPGNANTSPSQSMNTSNIPLVNPNLTGRTLGSPGLITANTAEQLERSGLVVEEFRPPQPRPEDLSLDGIPYEARQEFYRSLDLPAGSRVMSAQIVGGGNPTTSPPTTLSPTTSEVKLPSPAPNQDIPRLSHPQVSRPQPSTLPRTGTLGDPGIQNLPSLGAEGTKPQINPARNEEVKPTVANDVNVLPVPKTTLKEAVDSNKTVVVPEPKPLVPQTPIEPPKPDPMIETLKVEKEQLVAEKELLSQKLEETSKALASRELEMNELRNKSREILDALESAKKQQAEMQDSVKAMTTNLQSRMKELEDANRETANMLEKRTAEVSELQKKLADQEKASKETNTKKPKKKKSHNDD